MTLKVHFYGPRSDKFPYKAQGSWFAKFDNTVHKVLQDRMITEGISLEEAILRSIMEGAKLMMKDKEAKDEPTQNS